MIILKEKNEFDQSVWFLADQECKKIVYRGGTDGSVGISVGLGLLEKLDRLKVKEIGSLIARKMNELGHQSFGICVTPLIQSLGADIICDLAEGVLLENIEDQEVIFFGEKFSYNMETEIDNTKRLVDSILYARRLVNLPGNMLHPLGFGKSVAKEFEGTDVEITQIVYGQMKDMGMGALAGIGESSENPPCLYIIRYHGNPDSEENIGLIGEGLTCDTGGYCLKKQAYMPYIKADMAGGAAVAGAILTLAKNHIRTNVTGIIPMCENRISPASLLPGDVITSYSGKTIEVLNTDAGGALVLADAVTYAVRDEKVTSIIDVGTLTGSVIDTFGITVAGMMTDSKEMRDHFLKASAQSGEHYWELPFYDEHEKMLKSNNADLKNVGEKWCEAITTGVFIRTFAEEKPWMHLDIAGTAWVNVPPYEFQKAGATGAAVSTLYYYCKN